MNFPKYWKKGSFTGKMGDGKEITIEAFGWSFESLAEAQAYGTMRAKRAVEIGIGSEKQNSYDYGDIPFREEVVSRIELNAKEIGVISRNRYGALVLNSANVLFVDIDSEEDSSTDDLTNDQSTGFISSLFRTLFHKPKTSKPTSKNNLEKIDSWALQNPQKSFRLYKTHSGLRLLFTDVLYEPKGSETKRIFQELESDPLYQKLTHRQECFRARLTPKPWRCHLYRSPWPFPWENEKHETIQREWEKEYHQKIQPFDTCLLIKEYGNPNIASQEIARIIEVHDKCTLGIGTALA